jgi:hypothetical protein
MIRRRKNLSARMTRLVRQLDRAREAQTTIRTQRRAFYDQHKNVIKEYTQLHTKLRHYRQRERSLIHCIDEEGTDAPHLTFLGFQEEESDADDA